MSEVFDIANEIWTKKYKYPGSKTVPADNTFEDTARRIATALASKEKDVKKYTEEFFNILKDKKFLPGGRIMSNAGTSRDQTTMFNCFVMGTIEDSMEGIFKSITDSAMTQKQGGGVGFDFSTIRPNGSNVKGCESEASGPISFMRIYDTAARTISSAGQRRSAQLAALRCDHPDIEEFIDAKRENGQLQMFNLSVAVTDKFMDAVKNDKDFDLVFGGKVYKTVKAKYLWDKITRSTYEWAEPGVLFIDTINKMNNLAFAEKISASNPCVSLDTPILTKEYGNIEIGKVLDQSVTVWNGSEWSPDVIPRITGENQPMLRITFSDGSHLDCTHYHGFDIVNRRQGERVDAKDLMIGDTLEPYGFPIIEEGRSMDENEAYTWGFFCGDGSIATNRNRRDIYLYGNKINLINNFRKVHNVIPCNNRYFVELEDTFWNNNKITIPNDYDFKTKLAWLSGLIDSDGSHNGWGSISISSVEYNFLVSVKYMLTTMGCPSTIAIMKSEGFKLMPDGKGGHKEYLCQTSYRLTISGFYINKLMKFGLSPKRVKPMSIHRSASRFIFVTNISNIGVANKVACFNEPLRHKGTFGGVLTRNCGEQVLPPYGACLLGSVNLTKFVIDPFVNCARFDYTEFEKTVSTATRMLDNVIDMSNFPLEEQKKEAYSKRRMGIGITGLADTLVMLNKSYNSSDAISQVDTIMHILVYASYYTSVELAKEKGCCPFLESKESRNKYCESNFLKQAFTSENHNELVENIKKYGIRNTHLTSVAPTGTISMVAGNVSSGIEPIFALTYDRKIRKGQTNEDTYTVEVRDYSYNLYKQIFKDVPLTPAFVTTDDLIPNDHIVMMSVVQKYIDSACSKTINCSPDMKFEDFQNVYMLAYENGLKGCTTFRPSDKLTGILIKKDDKKKEIEVKIPLVEEKKKEDIIASRPRELNGSTYKIKPAEGAAYYITINDYINEDGSIQPFELFINTKNVNGFSWIVAVSRLLSSVLRMSKDPMFIAEELSNVHDPNGGYWSNGKYVPSVPAEIGIILKNHINKNKAEKMPIAKASDTPKTTENDSIKGVDQVTKNKGTLCPNCGTYNYVKVDGCAKCLNCDYSKCG